MTNTALFYMQLVVILIARLAIWEFGGVRRIHGSKILPWHLCFCGETPNIQYFMGYFTTLDGKIQFGLYFCFVKLC